MRRIAVDDLLFVARNESGEARLTLADVDLGRLVRDTLDTFAPDVEGDVDAAVGTACVRADVHRVRQALLVLIDNARRHGAAANPRAPNVDGANPDAANLDTSNPDGANPGAAKAPAPRIRVRVARSGASWRIVVEDDGPGMDASDKLVAFKRFFRGSNAAERYGDGLGLGLPVAMSIAQAHGGTIELADAASGGLRATLVLPADEGALAGASGHRSADASTASAAFPLGRRGAAA